VLNLLRSRLRGHVRRPANQVVRVAASLLLVVLTQAALPAAAQPPTLAPTATASPVPQPATTEQLPRTVAQAAAEPPNVLRVVLLLPLESALLRRAAVSVRDGAAAVFATRKADLSVRECSYSADGVVAAYSRCVDDKVDWVIGPLGRSDVATLALAKVAALRPTLASGAMASRVSVAIMSYWRGRIATPLTQIALGSRESWRRLTDGWRRDNVDCILFAGGGGALSELRPFLRNMAVYVTSASFEATLERATDWTGVRIADAPWLVDAERAEFAAYLPPESPSPTLARLYALGVDAARLVIAAGRDALPSTFEGAIGQLTLKDAQYRRQPMIGEFRERSLVKVGP